MKLLIGLLLVAGIAANAALFAWQLRSPPKSVLTTSSSEAVVMRTPGGVLEVSTITAHERFDSAVNHTILGVSLGKTVAQARARAVYRYHIPLAKDWTLRRSGNSLLVMAPRVRPSLPVAIDTKTLEVFASGVWSPLTGSAQIDSLQRSISDSLAAKAVTPDLIKLQREAARQTVTEFIQKWVVQQPSWNGKQAPNILVFFEDEPLGQRALKLLAES